MIKGYDLLAGFTENNVISDLFSLKIWFASDMSVFFLFEISGEGCET